MRVIPGELDDNFTIRVAHEFETSAAKKGFIGKEYILDKIAAGPDNDFTVYVAKGGDSLAVENQGGQIKFDVWMTSTESEDYCMEKLSYVPGSSEENILLGKSTALTMTPENWGTTEQAGELHILKTGLGAETGGIQFPIVIIIVLAVVAVSGIAYAIIVRRTRRARR
jgi:hypothetical protein